MTRILVVSDLHCGSIYGLCPPGFELASGNRVQLNEGQKWLWRCWQGLKAHGPFDIVVLNGDLIDGRQQAQHATETCSPFLEDQATMAASCIAHLLADAASHRAPVYGVQGTEYHDQKAGEYVDRVLEKLGVRKSRGRVSHEVLNLEVDGYVLNFSHGISVSSGLYRSTALDREALFATLAAREGRSVRADVIVRSHAHIFVHVELAHKHAVITPCWQLQTRYMRRNSVYRMIPDIGAVIIEIGSRGPSIVKVLFDGAPLPVSTTVKARS